MKKNLVLLLIVWNCHTVLAQQADPTFNTIGFVYPTPPSGANYNDQFISINQFSTGKFLVTAYRETGVRTRLYNSDGSWDQSYGWSVNNNGFGFPFTTAGPVETVILPGDKLLVASGGNGSYMFTRLNPDGNPDLTFGPYGTKTVNSFTYAFPSAPVLTADNKLVFVGRRTYSDATWPYHATTSLFRAIEIAKFNLDGTPDTTFNGTGYLAIVQTEPDVYDVKSFCVTSDRIYVLNGYNKISVIDYNSGTLDTDINGNGLYFLPTNFRANKIFALSDGKILFSKYNNPATSGQIFRMNADLSPDLTFGVNQMVDMPLVIKNMIQQPDGKMVFTGTPLTRVGGFVSSWFKLVRTNTDGSTDTGSSSGMIQFEMGPFGNSYGERLYIQEDGKYLIGGTYKWREMEYDWQEWGLYLMRLVPGTLLQSQSFNANVFSVYPNPIQDKIHIAYQNETPDEVQLYDLQGRMVFSTKDLIDSNAFEKEILMPDLSKGTYLLRVFSKTGQTQNVKIIKQ